MTKVAVRTRTLTLSLALCLPCLISANRIWAGPGHLPTGLLRHSAEPVVEFQYWQRQNVGPPRRADFRWRR